MIDQVLAQEKERGNVIPNFLLRQKYVDPETGKQSSMSAFATEVLTEFTAAVQRNPRAQERLQQLETMPPGPESKAVADAFYAQMRAQYLGPIIQRAIKSRQDGMLEYQNDRAGQQRQIAQVASPEPRSGAVPAPQTFSSEQLRARALETARKLPGFESMTPQEQLEAELNERHKLRGIA